MFRESGIITIDPSHGETGRAKYKGRFKIGRLPTTTGRSEKTNHCGKDRKMTLRLGDEAPNFSAETTEGRMDFHEWLGSSWGVLFSHPADFTPLMLYSFFFQNSHQKRRYCLSSLILRRPYSSAFSST